MPVSIEPRPDQRRINVTMPPDATAVNRLQAVHDLTRVLAAHPGFGALIDVRAPENQLTGEDARRIIEAVIAHTAAFRGGIALLARPGVSYGIARVEQAIGEVHGIEMAVFTEPAEAGRWLAMIQPAEGL